MICRCGDAAPTVRIRAVNALSLLLETFADDQACDPEEALPEKCNFLLDLMLGMAVGPAPAATTVTSPNVIDSSRTNEPQTPTSSTTSRRSDKDAMQENSNDSKQVYNLLETLRNRVHDDKPLVRGRAVNTFGTALRIKWPKYSPVLVPFEMLLQDMKDDESNATAAEHSQSTTTATATVTTPTTGQLQLEYVSLFLAEDDINILIERCDDVSVSVRKNTIGVLSLLAAARPGDAVVLDAWVCTQTQHHDR